MQGGRNQQQINSISINISKERDNNRITNTMDHNDIQAIKSELISDQFSKRHGTFFNSIANQKQPS